MCGQHAPAVSGAIALSRVIRNDTVISAGVTSATRDEELNRASGDGAPRRHARRRSEQSGNEQTVPCALGVQFAPVDLKPVPCTFERQPQDREDSPALVQAGKSRPARERSRHHVG